jgi:hypothetical protein
MIGVSSAIVAYDCAECLGQAGEVRDELVDALPCQLGMSGRGCVEIVYIGLMVLVVVQVHGSSVEAGLESIVGIR